MVFNTASAYRQQACQRLTQDPAAKRLVLIHALVAQGGTLLVYFIGYLAGLLIDNSGGLSGMGIRSILSTVQTTLETVATMALPFWQASIFFISLCWARSCNTRTDDLFQGFRRLGPVLGFRILYGVIFAVLGFTLFYPCAIIFLLTPFSAPFLEKFAPLFDPASTTQEIEAILTPEYLENTADTMMPMFILFAIVFFLIAVPVFYRLRLGDFAVMDGYRGGRALLCSFRATKKNWRQLVKLDLHFWWYYALQALCLVLANGNWLLPWLGITLPMGEDAAFFLFFGLGTALQTLVLWQFQGQVLTSYALLYDDLSLPQTKPLLEEV